MVFPAPFSSLNPRITVSGLICESLALYVSVLSQLPDLLKELQCEYRLTYLFVVQNLDVGNFYDAVAVMRRGRNVELAPAGQIFSASAHPSTGILLSAVPSPDPAGPTNFRVADGLAAFDANA